MGWTAFPSGGRSAPLLAFGDLWTVSLGGNTAYFWRMTTSGVLTFADLGYGFHDPSYITRMVADADYVYSMVSNDFPGENMAVIDPSTMTAAIPNNGGIYYANGLVLTGSETAMVTGSSTFSHGSVATFSLSASPSIDAEQDYTPPSRDFGQACFDGSLVWTVGDDGNLYSIDPTDITATPSQYVQASPLGQGQIGFDGTYLYIGVDAGGIMVWDISTSAGTIYGTALIANCWYSANLSSVIASDGLSSGNNIYAMPAAGGAFLNIGNSDSITGDVNSTVYGFCDGPTDDVWASVNDSGGNAYMIQFTGSLTSGANPIVMLV